MAGRKSMLYLFLIIAMLILVSQNTGGVYAYNPVVSESDTLVMRLPYVFSSGIILRDGTIVGVSGGKVLFIKGVNILKTIPLIGGSGNVTGFPQDNPVNAVIYSSGGDIILADSSGNILYRTIIGFGELKKAFYSSGIIYMLVHTRHGDNMYAYEVDSNTWGYISAYQQNLTNTIKILDGSVLDIMGCGYCISVLYDPALPPGVKEYITLPLLVMDNKGNPVSNVEVILYYREFDFSFRTIINRSSLIRIPVPVQEVSIFAKYNDTWYMYNIGKNNLTRNGLVIKVPGKKVIPPPLHLFNHYVAIIEGFNVKHVYPAGPTDELLACSPSKIVLYSKSNNAIYFVDIKSRYKTGFNVDSEPISASLKGSLFALGTSTGTVYLFNIDSNTLYHTYSFPGIRDTKLSENYLFIHSNGSIHAVSIKSLKDIFLYNSPGLQVKTRYIYTNSNDILMFSTEDSTLIIKKLNKTEPFTLDKFVPYKVILNVVDPWMHYVNNAKVFVDNILIGETDEKGKITFSLNKGGHDILIEPPPSNKNLTITSKHIYITNNSNITIILNRTIYRLSLYIIDNNSKNNILKEPVTVKIMNSTGTEILNKKYAGEVPLVVWVRKGTYIIYINSTQKTPYYETIKTNIIVNNDTRKYIYIKYKLYKIQINVIDRNSKEWIKSKICTGNTCTTNSTLKIPKGIYNIIVTPLEKYNNTYLYNSVKIKIKVPDKNEINITVRRKYFIIKINFIDKFSGKPILIPLDVTLGNTLYKNVKEIETILPQGENLVVIHGNNLYASSTISLNVYKDGNYSIKISRNKKNAIIKISSIVSGSIKDGILIINSSTGYSKILNVPENGEVNVVLPVGVYRVTYRSPYFRTVSKTLNLIYGNRLDIVARPTFRGVLLSYSNFILSSVGVVLSTILMIIIYRKILNRLKNIKEVSELIGDQ